MLHFYRFQPKQSLKPYIANLYFWRFTPGKSETLPAIRVLPTGKIYINFVQEGKPFETRCRNKQFSYYPNLINGTVYNEDIYMRVKTGAVLGAEFYPYGFTALTGLQASDFTNNQTNLCDMMGKQIDFLNEKTRETPEPAAKVEILNNWLEGFLMKDNYRYPLLEEALDIIHGQKGAVSVKDLREATRMGERTLEKKFHRWVGIPPKYYINIVRINSFLAHCIARDGKPWNLHIDTRCFYDQAHFIKTFKKVAGLPPREYLDSIDQTLDYNFVGR